jgi:hypothetical protein
MSDDDGIDAALEPLLTLTIETRLARTVSGTPLGNRAVFDVVGGRFEGARLSGRVLASGGDWLLRAGERSQLDVRLLLETDDGVTILLRYSGKASQRAGKPRIEVAGVFEAPPGPYDWLNDLQAFGLGVQRPEGIRYHLFRFR